MAQTLKHLFTAIAVTLVVAAASFGQATTATPQSTDNYVTEKNFKNKEFEVKYRDPNSLANVLTRLTSGFKGAGITPNVEFKTLTVRDFPENIATIEEALKRLDTPAAPHPDIELHMHVLLASNTGSGGPEAPAELKDVLAELRGTLNYKNYELVASVVQRLTETSSVLQGNGTAEMSSGNSGAPNLSMPYEYYIRSVSLIPNPGGVQSLQIADFAFTSSTGNDRARIQTALNLRDGEKVVVGTATIRNRALIVVLTAKLLK